MKQQLKESSRKPFDFPFFLMVFAILGFYYSTLNFPPGPIAATKPFNSFEEFYPFYLTQHHDFTCKLCHIVGTGLIVAISTSDISIFLSGVLALLVGCTSFPLTRSFDHGFIEMGLMILTFILVMKKLTGSISKALFVPILGYSFAWVGHFVFEKNRPATFIYPTFSLMGDFRMFFEYILQALAVQQ